MEQQNTTPKIRVVFMGTPDFAQTILNRLITEQYNIVAAYTQPDKPIGRKQEIQASPVKLLAQEHSIPVEQPEKLDEDATKKLATYKPDLIIVVAYGKLLPKRVLGIPGFGCINVHPSLLPKFRGPSPIQNALLHGDQETGTTLMLLDEGMDSGDIIAQEKITISPDEISPILSKRLADLSASLLVQTLPKFVGREIQPQKQDATKATLCQLIDREDGRIIWSKNAENIYNRYRALYDWPGIYCFWRSKNDEQLIRIKLNRIEIQRQNPQAKHHIGEVFELGEKIGIQTGEGVVFINELQMEGKSPTPIEEFIKGYPHFIGHILQ